MGKVILVRHHDDSNDEYNDVHGFHFSQRLLKEACSKMVNADGTDHRWTTDQVNDLIREMNYKLPIGHSIEDVTYTVNMAYADFFPTLLNERQCIDYAMLVANDPDGYDGIEFSRWLADVKQKHIDINLNEFI